MDEQKNEGKNKTTLYCSFCGKSQHEVKKLIAGPTVFICDECVELCMDIIKEEHQSSITKNKEGIPSPIENLINCPILGICIATCSPDCKRRGKKYRNQE